MITSDQPTIFDTSKVRVVVSGKADGHVKSNGPGDVDKVTANIRAIAEKADLPFDSIVALNVAAHQDAWDEIIDITSKPDHPLIAWDERVVADALVTNVPGLVLLLPVADCNAVAIHDPVHHVLAVVHLGWQSTIADLATKIVQHLQHTYHSSATDLRIFISPSIRAESYIFDEVSQAEEPGWRPYLHKTEKGIGVDLPGYNRQRFIDAGVMPEHIELSPVNTETSTDYFSHYRSVRTGEPEGRFALFATLS
jgi:copper oxidase (laccase) domain-containing protein